MYPSSIFHQEPSLTKKNKQGKKNSSPKLTNIMKASVIMYNVHTHILPPLRRSVGKCPLLI